MTKTLIENIPTNIITGFLGVGKTSAVNALLSQKPKGETWAILVNEFGQIGIDQAAIHKDGLSDSDEVAIKELAGGCICCALGPALTSTLAILLRRSKPDRLIIEPTGIGHPSGIIDTLQSDTFKDVLDLRSIICLLDPRSLDDNDVIANPIFQDQINLADVIAINKTDLATTEQVNGAEQRANSLFPPKQKVVKNHNGQIDLELLDLVRKDELSAVFPDAHSHNREDNLQVPSTASTPQPLFELQPKPGVPLYKEGQAKQSESVSLYTCGWVFNNSDTFELDPLIELLQSLPNIQRIKGVIRTEHDWLFYNQVLNESTCSPIAYRRDSRLEIISTQALPWQTIKQQLINCLNQAKQKI